MGPRRKGGRKEEDGKRSNSSQPHTGAKKRDKINEDIL